MYPVPAASLPSICRGNPSDLGVESFLGNTDVEYARLGRAPTHFDNPLCELCAYIIERRELLKLVVWNTSITMRLAPTQRATRQHLV
jgi:hypothetical protein